MNRTMCSRCEEKPAAICISCLTDCTLKQQPTAGKFTAKVRLNVQNSKSVIKKITDIRILSIIGWIPQLCDQLDTSEARLKDLLTVCEKARKYLPQCFTQQLMDEMDVAIAKAKKEG